MGHRVNPAVESPQGKTFLVTYWITRFCRFLPASILGLTVRADRSLPSFAGIAAGKLSVEIDVEVSPVRPTKALTNPATGDAHLSHFAARPMPFTCSVADQRETSASAGSKATALQRGPVSPAQSSRAPLLDKLIPQAKTQIARSCVTQPSDTAMEHTVQPGPILSASGETYRGPAAASGAGTTNHSALNATSVLEASGSRQPQPLVQCAGSCQGAQVPYSSPFVLDDKQNEVAAQAGDTASVGHAAPSGAEPRQPSGAEPLRLEGLETQKLRTLKRGAASEGLGLAGGIGKGRQTCSQVRSIRKGVVDLRLRSRFTQEKLGAASAADAGPQITATSHSRNPSSKAPAGKVQEVSRYQRAKAGHPSELNHEGDRCAEGNSDCRMQNVSNAGCSAASEAPRSAVNAATWIFPPVAPRARSSEVVVGARIVRVRCPP